jgi:hypothetical protein
MSRETVEVDKDYLWALEVIACADSNLRAYQSSETISEANRVIDRANLNRPRDREEVKY